MTTKAEYIEANHFLRREIGKEKTKNRKLREQLAAKQRVIDDACRVVDRAGRRDPGDALCDERVLVTGIEERLRQRDQRIRELEARNG